MSVPERSADRSAGERLSGAHPAAGERLSGAILLRLTAALVALAAGVAAVVIVIVLLRGVLAT